MVRAARLALGRGPPYGFVLMDEKVSERPMNGKFNERRAAEATTPSSRVSLADSTRWNSPWGATISGLHVICLWTFSHYMQSWSPLLRLFVWNEHLAIPAILMRGLIIICPMKVWRYTMVYPCIPHFVGTSHVNHSRSTGRRP